MSQYTDWFLADPSEAPDLAASPPDELTDRWESVSLRNVLELELQALAKVLLGGAFHYDPELLYPDDPGMKSRPDQDVTSEQLDGGAYVMRIPDELVRALAALDDASLDKVGAAWRSEAEEMRALSRPQLAEVLRSMRSFAARALSLRKSVLNVFEI